MAEGHAARPLEKKEGRMAMEGQKPQAKGGRVGQAAEGRYREHGRLLHGDAD